MCLVCLLGIIDVQAQDRINEAPKSLTYKSKEIKRANYWSQENGIWERRPNTSRPYLVGVQSDNFKSIFIGDIDSLKFIFVDYYKAQYKYPNLELDWTYYPKIQACLISTDSYEELKNIQQGQIVGVRSNYYLEMFKSGQEYSFPLFLELVEQLYSSHKLLYKMQLEEMGKDYADNYWREQYPEQYALIAKRVLSENKDVVRFHCLLPILFITKMRPFIESWYFEIPYNEFMKLFEPDKTLFHR